MSSLITSTHFSPWFVAQLKPNQLVRAQANLTRQDIKWFMPQISEGAWRQGRLVSVLRPLFPGYLFVKPVSKQSASVINSTYGVQRLIMRDRETPQPVPAAVIEWLEVHTEADGIFNTGVDLKPGDAVRLRSGPWAGYIGEVASSSGTERINILLAIMGRAARVNISVQDVIKIDRKS